MKRGRGRYGGGGLKGGEGVRDEERKGQRWLFSRNNRRASDYLDNNMAEIPERCVALKRYFSCYYVLLKAIKKNF